MPHGYCTECRAQVTVRDGQCLLDHVVDPTTIEETRGRRLRASARRRRGTHDSRVTARGDQRLRVADSTPRGGGVALLERDDWHLPEPPSVAAIPSPVLGAPPGRLTAPVTDADTLSVTGLLVEELWNLSPDEDILGWTPGELDETLVRTGVRKRKIVALGALALVAVLIGWRAWTWENSATAASIEAVTEASATLVDQVQAVDSPAADISDGTVDDPLAASTALARLDESARALFTIAGDLPIDTELAVVREQAITQAGGALELGTTLSESVAYASAVHLITRPVELPPQTDIDGLPGVTESVTGWVADFMAGVASLPGNDLTDTHRTGMEDLAASLPDWQASYLDALRAKDAARAAGHIAELETQIAFVRESWTDAAKSIGDWVDHQIEVLAVPLDVNR